MKSDQPKSWCSGALSSGAPVHQSQQTSLKALADKALRDRVPAPKRHGSGMSGAPDLGASGAVGARGASGADNAIRSRLLVIATQLGIPRAIVDSLPLIELQTTAEQVALASDHLDGNGNPLAHSLLVFYLRSLAKRVTP